MEKNVTTQLELLNQIMASKNLTPLFQPIISLKTQEIFGYEALIRGPSDSPLHSPASLFNAALKHNQLAELDLLCREVIIKKFGELKLDQKLFINTSPAALIQDNYPHGKTLEFLQAAGLTADKVIIELTEQYPIEDYDLMRQATQHYRDMGFSIAIDDLGAGYSGLRTWSELEPDFVKLDRHFLQNIHEDQHKRQFVKSMIDIAQSINCQVIGEGIEVREEYLTAQPLEMPFAQGYYFGRPHQLPQQKLDANLFSVRKKNSVHYHGRPRKNTLVSSLLKSLTPLHDTDTVNQAGDRFQQDTRLAALPVIDQSAKVVGIIWRDDFLTMYASRYGRELFGRKPVKQFMDKQPLVVETDLPLKKLSYQITSQAEQYQHSMFVITEQNRYKGVGSLIDLLRQITDMQITMARHANPLSGLPGNVPISELTREAIEDKKDITICYVDLDNFKPYNDVYGFGKGDQVISLTARLLAEKVNTEIDFVGHVGGDDFIILFESKDWQLRCERILTAFTALHDAFYKAQHLAKGGIHAQDRYGKPTFYPLLSLSIGAVQLKEFEYLSHEADLAELASKAKSRAKCCPGNCLFLLDKAACDVVELNQIQKLA